LRSSIRRFVEDVFFHVPRFQPFLENGSVHRDVRQKPIVGNLIEGHHDTLPTSRTYQSMSGLLARSTRLTGKNWLSLGDGVIRASHIWF
jgi:hypothetical protein